MVFNLWSILLNYMILDITLWKRGIVFCDLRAYHFHLENTHSSVRTKCFEFLPYFDIP